MYQHINVEETKTLEFDMSTSEIVGKRVRLKSTADSCSMLGFNDLGTITAVYNLPEWKARQMKLWIKWDNGSNYPLIDGVDSFDIFREAGI